MTRDDIVAGAFESIQQGSKSFRAASRLFDQQTRERASLLYCWCRHCDDVCDGQVYGFGKAARGKVSVLRGKTRRAIAGDPPDELPYQALALLLSECPIPPRFLEDHLRGFDLDEVGWRPETEEDLITYCYYVAGAVGCMMAILMGVSESDEETLTRASHLGIAFQISNIARDVREDWENGRCYIPQQWLAEFGLEGGDLLDPAKREALTLIVDRLIDRVALFETSARKGTRELPFRSRLAVLSALRIYGAIGRRVRDEVAAKGSAAWDQRVTVGRARKLSFVFPSLVESLVLRPD